MPNHIHIITKTRNNYSLADINRGFKKFTAQKIIFAMKDRHDNLIKSFTVNKSGRKIQHNNLCQKKWKLANLPEEYEFSSASFYIKDIPNKHLGLFDLRKIL